MNNYESLQTKEDFEALTGSGIAKKKRSTFLVDTISFDVTQQCHVYMS
jgi:hypothetical protein